MKVPVTVAVRPATSSRCSLQSGYLDVLAWNHLAAAVYKDFATVPRQERNFLRMLFLDADVRSRFVDWEPVARTVVAFFRAATPTEPRLAHLIGELSRADPDFRTWWAERHVSYTTSGTRTYTHPLTGPYTLTGSSSSSQKATTSS